MEGQLFDPFHSEKIVLEPVASQNNLATSVSYR